MGAGEAVLREMGPWGRRMGQRELPKRLEDGASRSHAGAVGGSMGGHTQVPKDLAPFVRATGQGVLGESVG